MCQRLQVVYSMTACGSVEFYIGSTTRTLKDRLRLHKLRSKTSNSKVSKWIREVGSDSLVMYGATLNMNRPITTREEHLNDMVGLNSKKLLCLCGKVVSQSSLCSHKRTKKHQKKAFFPYPIG